MNKELFILAGVASYGDSWKTQTQTALGVTNRQTITKWVKGINNIPDRVQYEMLSLLKVRQREVENAIDAIESYTGAVNSDFIDYDRTYTVVSEGGELLEERFNTLEDAQAWVNDAFGEDDLYLVKYHEMTEAENLSMLVIQEYGDMLEQQAILDVIQDENNVSDKSAQEVYCDLAMLIQPCSHTADYFDYYMKNELMFETARASKIKLEYLRKIGGGLGTPPDEDEFIERAPTLTYKQYIMREIAILTEYIAALP